MENSQRRRGRRPGRPDTRAAILDAARARFLAEGYHAVSLRSIAADAGVDFALISYYFGSKKGLFGAALALPANPAEILARLLDEGDWATFPERALYGLLQVWDDPQTGLVLLVLLKNAAHDEAFAALVKEVVEREIVERLAGRLGGRDAHERAGVFAAQMSGLITARYLLRLEPVASMAPDEIVRLFAPQLRLALSRPGKGTAARAARSAPGVDRP